MEKLQILIPKYATKFLAKYEKIRFYEEKSGTS